LGGSVSPSYPHLFSPISIGKVRLRNRIVKTAAQTYFFETGERRFGGIAKAFYGAVARGGAGLVICETPAMEAPYKETDDRRYRIDDDRFLPDIEALAAEVHQFGCPLFLQFYHRGPWGGVYAVGRTRVAASAVTLRSPFDVLEEEPPHALTIPEIQEIVEAFVDGAARAARGGVDGIEVNAADDHLLATFLSRFWNRRDDEYGPQSMESRARIVVEIVQGIKRRAGRDFPVQVRMNAIEIGAGEQGFSLDEGKQLAALLEAAGVDSLQVKSHWMGMHQGSYNQEVLFYPEPHIKPGDFPAELDWSRRGLGAQVPLAAIIKPVVSIPVMAVGGLDADLGEQALREGNVDLIGINRRFFADPDYARKVQEGRLDDIQPCTHCGTCNTNYNLPRYCRINACFGTDQRDLAPPGRKKRVLVVGGGPAGMQAARIAARRGHDVRLWEKGRYLGGATPLAAMVKGSEVDTLPEFIEFFRRQVRTTGVKVELGREFDPGVLDHILPDAVVLALGGTPVLPDVPGLDGRNVIKTTDLYGRLRLYLRLFGPRLLRELTRLWMPVGDRVVIIGGAIQGCQLAEFLIKRDRKVTIVETGDELGAGLVPERKTRLFYWFDKKGAELLTGVTLVRITSEGLSIVTREGAPRLLAADSIIPVLPYAPTLGMTEHVKARVTEVHTIGDCESPATIPEATAAGWRVGNVL
jgi:2,4-dienoyl-CoA reductase (NADPH2)